MTWCSELRAIPGFVLASSAIRCRFVDRFVGLPPMFRVNGSLLLALPFPRPGPAERGSPTLPVLWRRYDFPPAHPRSLIGFASGAHAVLPRFVSRRGAPEPPEGAAQAGVRCSAGDPFPAAPHVDVSGISQVSWPSIPCLCPGLRPRPNRQPLALAVLSMLPPHPTRRRLRRLHDFEATAGLRHPLPTLHDRRCRRPCKARFRLAGWPLPGGSRTLWSAMKGFRSSSRRPPFQDLACRKLDPRRTADPQADAVHAGPGSGSRVGPSPDLVALRRSQGLLPGPDAGGQISPAPALRAHLR